VEDWFSLALRAAGSPALQKLQLLHLSGRLTWNSGSERAPVREIPLDQNVYRDSEGKASTQSDN